MKDLRILACSDLHGSLPALEMIEKASASSAYDLVVVCGDFTTFGALDYTKEFLKRIKTRVLAVPGNCDVPDTVPLLEENNASVHNLQVEFGGRKFFGFGGAVPSTMGMPFEIEESIIERSLRAVAVEGGIMVTHTPAYGMNDLGKSRKHAGLKAILRVAEEFKPVLALSGHFHESKGKVLTMDTAFVNPGSAKNGHYASVVVGDAVEVELHEPKHG